ncbi:MAG: hypothetical protein LBL96_01220 [Clostridiales bacterium]|nr:hypothetical protein [Clostridiales bacterium]
MEFMPMRALSREPQTVISQLQRDGELVVTNNGQPIILMIDLAGRDLVEVVNIVRNKCTASSPDTTGKTQRAAFERFFAAIGAIDDEAITDADIAQFENNQVNIGRDLDL